MLTNQVKIKCYLFMLFKVSSWVIAADVAVIEMTNGEHVCQKCRVSFMVDHAPKGVLRNSYPTAPTTDSMVNINNVTELTVTQSLS